ncbi:ABC transporter permease [Cellulomonas bogoriensis]|nr:ABC transporter permease [Cellulomonas bogoriensis]
MTRHPVLLVAAREVRTRVATRSTLISLGIMVVVIVAGAVLLSVFQDRDQDDAPDLPLGLDTSVAVLTEHLQAAGETYGRTVTTTALTPDQGTDALTADPQDGTDTVAAYISGDPRAPEVLVAETADEVLLEIVRAAVVQHVLTQEVADLGGDPDALATALATAEPQVSSVTDADDEFDPVAYTIAVLMISVLLFSLISAGSVIAMGVVEEKTSRVVELLLSTIKPSQLLAGKILGIGVFGLLQVLVLGGAAAAAALATGLADRFQVDVGGALAALILWFLLGYALYALLFGGFAALVSRQEEIGAVTTPLMFVLFVPYYVTLFVVTGAPDGTVARVLTYIPFTAPFVVPVREAIGTVPVWEVAAGAAVTLLTIPVLVWLAGRVYRRAVLHTGGRMKLGTALKG